MAVNVNYVAHVTVTETIDTTVPAVDAGRDKIVHNGFDSSATHNASTTVPATQVAAFTQSLSSGTAIIDFTSLTSTKGTTVNGTGLKVQFLKVKNKAGNGTLKIDVGAINGLDLFGAGFEITLSAGQEVLLFGNDATPDVGASDLAIDLTGTGSEQSEWMVVLG